MAEPSLQLGQEDGRTVLYAAGCWDIEHVGKQPAMPALATGGVLVLDGAGIEAIDPSGAFKLMHSLHAAGIHLEHLQVRGMAPRMLEVWQLVGEHFSRTQEAPPKWRTGLFYHVGLGTSKTIEHTIGFANFVGRLANEVYRLAKGPGGFRHREFVAQMEEIFVYAIPISMAMIFLMGLVFAYLLGVQAEKFGANIYVVDGVAMAILREISPVIVAILGLVRVHQGSHLAFERRKVNGEEWLPASASYTASARVLLLKRVRVSARMEFSDYRKFTVATETTVAPPK